MLIISRSQLQTFHGSLQEPIAEPHDSQEESPLMAQPPPTITFEDILLDDTRRMGRGPRMDPELYQAFKEKIESLGNTATRITLPEGTSLTTRKNRILRMAAELNTPVTRRQPFVEDTRTRHPPRRLPHGCSVC
jgi:hypothetical protein